MSYIASRKKLKRRSSEISTSRANGSKRFYGKNGELQKIKARLPDHHITESKGNVFLNLGRSPEEAHNLVLRSEMMIRITDIIKQRKLTQTRAAKIFGVSQPRISDLMRGKIDLFSLDSLINMLTRAGMAVHLVVEQSAA